MLALRQAVRLQTQGRGLGLAGALHDHRQVSRAPVQTACLAVPLLSDRSAADHDMAVILLEVRDLGADLGGLRRSRSGSRGSVVVSGTRRCSGVARRA